MGSGAEIVHLNRWHNSSTIAEILLPNNLLYSHHYKNYNSMVNKKGGPKEMKTTEIMDKI